MTTDASVFAEALRRAVDGFWTAPDIPMAVGEAYFLTLTDEQIDQVVEVARDKLAFELRSIEGAAA